MKRVVLLVSVLAAPHLAVADECAATAVLEGDDALVAPVRTTLNNRGVSTRQRAGCAPTRARIERSGEGFAIGLVDPDGRRSERTLADLDAAASLIESWARRDLNSAALFGWTIEALPPEQPEREAPAAASITALSAPRTRTGSPILFGVVAESGFDFGGEAWTGGRTVACVRIGPACVGALGRAATGDARNTHDILAVADADLPLTGAISLVGGVGAGYGWYSAAAQFESTTRTLHGDGTRLDAHLGFTVRLARYVALDLGVSVGVSPSARSLSTTFLPPPDSDGDQPDGGDGNPPDGEGGPGGEGGDPGGDDGNPPDGDEPDQPVPHTVTIEEPFGYVRAGIGLRIGMP